MSLFKLTSPYKPSGDQPKAIESLISGLREGKTDQMLLGITGSGKTFTMANVIASLGRPSLIMAHNKTLAAQIYGEMKELFPENAVEYFVSYYDYYQPEAYIARTDTYIEKDSSINEQIDLMRHSATRSLLEREDVIVVASISCIYGLGSPELYSQMVMNIKAGDKYIRDEFLSDLIKLQYERNDVSFDRGNFRIKGEHIDIFPSHYGTRAWRLSFFGDTLETIKEFDPLTGERFRTLENETLYANSHFVTPKEVIQKAISQIEIELQERLAFFHENQMHVEYHRLNQRTQYDMEMMAELGHCKGIENYSRYLTGRPAGSPPPTLFEYLPKNSLLFIDESHVSIPQLRAMYNGDQARKRSLVEHGFRLPSALDNRPLKFEEWMQLRPNTIYVSATPAEFELNQTYGEVVELIIRPTGLIDPQCIVKPATNQVDDLIDEIKKTTKKGLRVLVTTLTKKMAEDLTNYLLDLKYKVNYLHSSVQTLERIEIIRDLRLGNIEVLIGVNLLREGLDIPECGLVAILDADKEGFLRSRTSLIQTIGRAARNSEGRVILYADKITRSISEALAETDRRREIQIKHNEENNIKPTTINTKVRILAELDNTGSAGKKTTIAGQVIPKDPKEIEKKIASLRKEMLSAAKNLEFEKAANCRDQIHNLEKILMS